MWDPARGGHESPRQAPRRILGTTIAIAAAFFAPACDETPSISAAHQVVLNDWTDVSVEVADRGGYDSAETNAGAIVEYIGDENMTFGPSGTGVFDPFVRTQAHPDEQGYNTDGALEFDTKPGAWTHAILVSDIPVVSVGGGLYWELFADINDNDNTSTISLNGLEVYFTSDPELTGYPFGEDATKVYDFEGSIRINDVNQGSGRGDLRYRIPIVDLGVPSECGYKNPACSTYFVLYTQWGTTEGYETDGGFDEWKVKVYPYVTVSKTAATSFTRTFGWTIDKAVTPASWNLFSGETGTSMYTVAVAKDEGTDSDFAVAGTITVANSGTKGAPIQSVSDVMGGVSTAVDCGVSFPYVLPAGATLTCTYSMSVADSTARTNTARVVFAPIDDTNLVFTGTAPVVFDEPTTLVNDSIHVTDSFAGNLGSFSGSGSTSYPRTFGCDLDAGTHPNVATIVESGLSDAASVDVRCFEVAVRKTASTSFTRTYRWAIDKSGDQTELTLMPDQPFVVNYGVVVDATGYADSAWAAAGTITVQNPAPIAATIDAVNDMISGTGAASVNCGVSFPYSLAAGSSLSCSYTASLPDATSRTNTAAATRHNYAFAPNMSATPSGTSVISGTANVVFSSTPSTNVDECINVTDSYAGALGSACVHDSLPKTFTYSRTVGEVPRELCGDHTVPNTATFVANDTGATGSDIWSVLLHVVCPPPGCTLTQGYWKTHSEKGPAPYDDTWALLASGLGADTPFFISGATWHEVFWTPPSDGNAYYVLAHQYQAVVLNMLNGAGSIPEVDAAMAWAEAFFNAYPPTTEPAEDVREQAISVAGTLAGYNEGSIGPGHCSHDDTCSKTP